VIEPFIPFLNHQLDQVQAGLVDDGVVEVAVELDQLDFLPSLPSEARNVGGLVGLQESNCLIFFSVLQVRLEDS